MAAPWGLSDSGYSRPRYSEIRSVLEQRFKGRFGENRNTSDDTPDGHIISWVSEIMDLVFQADEGAYLSTFVASANGAALRELGVGIIGEPKSAAASTVELVLYGDDTTVVPAQSQAKIADSTVVFETDASATLGATDQTWVVRIDTVVDSQLYRITVDGDDYDFTSDGSAAMQEIVDGLVAELDADADITAYNGGVDGNGLGLIVLDTTAPVAAPTVNGNMTVRHAARVAATAIATGPFSALAGSTWSIETPVSGWIGAANTDDAVLGQNDETDEEYRQRIRLSTRYGGIAANVLKVTGVTYARTYENDTDDTDAEGRPPHSVETVVLGGADDDVAQAIWDMKAQGVQTIGLGTPDSGIAIDEAGVSRTVNFSRATELDIYVTVTVTQGEDWPTTGTPLAEIRDAIVDYVNALGVGGDVTPAGIFAAAVGAVTQIANLAILIDDTTPPVTSGVFAITTRQIATTDSTKVVVA
jgi:uncharacterized phage protein gp47/JayE